MSGLAFHMIKGASKTVGPASQAVEADGWVFVTGQLPIDPLDDTEPVPEFVEDQTRKVFENLVRVLAGLGLDLSHVAVARVSLSHFARDYPRMNAVYESYFPSDRMPVRSCVGVTGLARDCLVEIEVIARRPDAEPR
jgi:2-iminobutanoate/2-iminopropanoate deaminase